MATAEEVQKLALNWSLVVTSIPGYEDIGFVPKGDPDTLTTLLTNWSQAPVGYDEPTEAQLLTALAVVEVGIAVEETAKAIEDGAETAFTNIPDWATWTEQEAVDYITNNVTDLASAKVVMIRMARAILILADKTFPKRRSS